MMREKVCIVLNEREPAKAKAANALQARFEEHNITVSRMAIGDDIEQLVLERWPQIIVLDYLIGDYTTGLDILAAVVMSDKKDKPRVIFLTDEPSMAVAVDAMRLGAANYYELANPESLNNVVRESREILCKLENSAIRLPQPLKLSELIAVAPASRKMICKTKELVQKKPPVIVISGTPGSGLSALALAIAQETALNTCWHHLDLWTFDRSFEEALRVPPRFSGTLALGTNLSAIIEHTEEDDGELIDLLQQHQKMIWPKTARTDSFSSLLIPLSCPKTLSAWKRLPTVEVLTVPRLEERKDDISILLQLFLQSFASSLGIKVRDFPLEVITTIIELPWPGGIKQLKSVCTNAALSFALEHGKLPELIEEERERWEEFNSSDLQGELFDPYLAAAALDLARGSYRVAAARLGCGVYKLREIISTSQLNGDSQ